MIFRRLSDLLESASPGKDEVVRAGHSKHGVVNSVASQAAVAEDLPGLHAGEDVLDAGPDLLVGLVVRLLPPRGTPSYLAVGMGWIVADATSRGDRRIS